MFNLQVEPRAQVTTWNLNGSAEDTHFNLQLPFRFFNGSFHCVSCKLVNHDTILRRAHGESESCRQDPCLILWFKPFLRSHFHCFAFVWPLDDIQNTTAAGTTTSSETNTRTLPHGLLQVACMLDWKSGRTKWWDTLDVNSSISCCWSPGKRMKTVQ